MLRRTSSRSPATSCPATRALPAVGRTSVHSMLIVVDFPAPLGPRNPNVSPLWTSRSMPRTASISPNRFPSPRALTAEVVETTPLFYTDRTSARSPGGDLTELSPFLTRSRDWDSAPAQTDPEDAVSDGESPSGATGSGAVALLELLARAAPARVVAPELVVLVDAALLDRRGWLRAGRAGVDPVAPAAVGARLVLERAARVGVRPGATGLGADRLVAVGALDLDLDVVDHAREVRPDGVHQVLEERERLVLVGDQRLDLGEPAQVDPLAQVVHVIEMLTPAVVDDLQQQEPLDLPHDLVAELLLAAVVELHGRLAQPVDEFHAVELVDVEVGVLEVDGQDVAQRHEQPVEIPVLDVVADDVLVDQAIDHARDLLARLPAHVAALEDLVAVLVDDPALLVHHVVVLEHALADQEVLLLDLALGLLDLLRQDAGLDRLLVALLAGRAEALEDVVDAVACEQPHEVVLPGEEEPRLAGVPLAA